MSFTPLSGALVYTPTSGQPKSTFLDRGMDKDTRCVIAGAGPGGSMLALLLARRGVPVTLLEMHKDFDRQFRGDTVHPSTLEILDQLGLAEKVHEIPHSRVYGPSIVTSKGLFQPF